MLDDKKPRGRPVVTTPADIESAALRLWSERGFHEVSIADIAADVGVSPRTIFRRYRTKADLVWSPMEVAFRALGEALEQTPPLVPVLDRARSAVVRVIREADVDPAARNRIRIVASTPELQSGTSPAFTIWRESVFAFAAAQPGVDRLRAHVIAHCVQAAAMAGLIWWATEDSSEAPWQAVDDAFERLLDHDS